MSASTGNPPVHLHERVLAEWLDVDTNEPCSLGSCSLANQQTPRFSFRVDADPEAGRLCLRFALVLTVRAGGRNVRREFLLIIPSRAISQGPQAPLVFESLDGPELRASSGLNVSVLQDAGIMTSRRVIRAKVYLAAPGSVVMPRSTSKHVRPTTSTSRDLLLGLRSLAKAHSFTIYMKPSDYALHGLTALVHNLQSDVAYEEPEPELANLYDDGGDAMLVHWDQVEGTNNRKTAISMQEPPPPYEKAPVVQAQRSASSPATASDAETPTDGAFVAETPLPTPQTTVFRGLFSDINSDDDRFALMHAAKSDPDASDPRLADSDEERYALNIAREASQQLRDKAAGNDPRLFSELVAWLDGARTIKDDVHEYPGLLPKLRALGQHARTNDSAAFDATRAYCSALLFYNGRGDALPVGNPEARRLVSDMAALVRWAGQRRRGCEMTIPEVRREFTRLGDAARAVVSRSGDVAEYECQKNVCIARVLLDSQR